MKYLLRRASIVSESNIRSVRKPSDRKVHVSMLVEISEVSIDDDALRTKILCSCTHQSTPTSGIVVLWLRDEDYRVFVDGIGKVRFRPCHGRVSSIYHLHGVRRAEHLGSASLLMRRKHLQAVQIATISDSQLHKRITNLVKNGVSISFVQEEEYV